MKNLIENLPDKVNITVNKEDLIEFAQFLINEFQNEAPNKSDYAHESGSVQKTILNIEEAAELCNISTRTIYKKTSQGEIPHYKQSGKLFFKREELEAWLTEKKGFYKPDISAAGSRYYPFK